LIWATGSKYRELGVPGEGELLGRGITYCSICDGPLYKNKTVAVIGGGNTAMTSAIYMANIAKKVYIIDRSEVSKGDPVLLNQLKSKDNVDIINSVEVKEIHGEKKVTSITLNNGQNLDVDGVIINVGYQPVTDPIKSIVELNKYGYLEVDWKGMTKLPGFFAAGDVVFNPYKQLVVSASDGARAALGAYDYLSSN
ncbi:MAG: FAD-dependent oxidoreductase, partial [Candidatus Woesearchaeota archaeon]